MGGCINKGDGIPRAGIYYNLVRHSLLNEGAADINIALGKYLSYNQVEEKTRKLLAQKKTDVLCLFIRPFPLMPLQKPLIKYEKGDGKIGWALHPGLLSRKLIWPSKLTDHQKDGAFVYTPRKIFELRDVNLMIGKIFSLHRWAEQYLVNILSAVATMCAQQGTTLIVVSPPQSPGSKLGQQVCKNSAEFLYRFCLTHSILYVNINDMHLAYFKEDKIHFNEAGHAKLAMRLRHKLDIVLTIKKNQLVAGSSL